MDWNIFADGCPNGEPPNQVSARADRLIQKLTALEGNVALISHGHFSRVLAARWMGMPVISGQRFMLDTGTLSILQDDPRHPENRVISLWNAGPAIPL
jgi:probable phosphoglycerate mutase